MVLGFVMMFIPAFAAKPSFDCAKAAGSVEELICKDDELAALDRKMTEVYETALKKTPNSELNALKVFQRGWVKGRNIALHAGGFLGYPSSHGGVKSKYEVRISEL
jgi:uncharacterized protein